MLTYFAISISLQPFTSLGEFNPIEIRLGDKPVDFDDIKYLVWKFMPLKNDICIDKSHSGDHNDLPYYNESDDVTLRYFIAYYASKVVINPDTSKLTVDDQTRRERRLSPSSAIT